MATPSDSHHRQHNRAYRPSPPIHDDSRSTSSFRGDSQHYRHPSSQPRDTPHPNLSSADHSPEALVRIPQHILISSHLKLFGNKLVLAFESELNTKQVLDWLADFNEDNSIKLTLSDELQHSLFVVQFDSASGDSTRKTLLKRSPLKARDCYATVNNYGPYFNPGAQIDFCHLITVHIGHGSPQIYELLNLVLAPLGRLIRPGWPREWTYIAFQQLSRLLSSLSHPRYASNSRTNSRLQSLWTLHDRTFVVSSASPTDTNNLRARWLRLQHSAGILQSTLSSRLTDVTSLTDI